MAKDPMGDRMKEQYENRTRFMLPRRTYTIMRLDGRAFHTVTRGANRPYDEDFAKAMEETAMHVMSEVSGSVFGYVQSDEISLLLQDFESIGTQPWFGGNIQKMCSVAASEATLRFNQVWTGRPGTFDCRVFTLSDPVEVANYFIWRQRDAERNSILMTAQHHLGHRESQGLNTSELQEKLFQDKGVNWNNEPGWFKRGRIVVKVQVPTEVVYPGAPQFDGTVMRTVVSVGVVQNFTCEPNGWLAGMIPPLPTLKGESQ